MLPPIPTTWDALHPIIVHFPIALLLVAPVMLVIGLVWFSRWLPMFVAGLTLMVIGTLSGFLAESTGEAAAAMAIKTPPIMAAIERHAELAEATVVIFSILTGVFAALLFAAAIRPKLATRAIVTVVSVVFLVAYMAGSLVLANTGHRGGLLVHEYGLHAMLPASSVDPVDSGGHAEAPED